MLLRKLSFILLFLFYISTTQSQIVSHERYSSRNGLLADRITFIAQDSKGFIWFGSNFGLGYYDGYTFTRVPLPASQENKYVTSVLTNENKTYAAFLFSGGVAEIENGKTNAYSIKKNPLVSNDFTAFCATRKNGIIVASSDNKIYRLENGNFKLLFSLDASIPQNIITNIIEDIHGNLWIGSVRGLLIYKQDSNFDLLAKFFPDRNVFSLIKSDKGKIWLAYTNGITTVVITCTGFENGKLMHEQILFNQGGVTPVRFSGNVEKGFWGIDTERGLFNIPEQGSIKYFPDVVNTKADVSYIFSDRENNIWIANDPGVVKVSNQLSRIYLFDELAAGGGFITQSPDRSIWVTNSKYLYKIKQESIVKTTEFRLQTGGYIGQLLFDTHQDLWVARWETGLWRTKWKDDRLIRSEYHQRSNDKMVIPATIMMDDDGVVWLGGIHGLMAILPDGKFLHSDITIPQVHITAIAVDNKRKVLWLGDNAQGIIQMNYVITNDRRLELKFIRQIRDKDGLTDAHIRSLLLDTYGKLWVGTRVGGVFRITEESNKVVVEHFSKNAGIPCGRITSIVEESGKAIWFASCDGVHRYFHSSGTWEHYHTREGLASAEIFSITIDTLAKQLWAAGITGVTSLDYDRRIENIATPITTITAVNILGKPDSAALYFEGERRFSAGQNSVGFNFSGGSFIDEKNILYRYKLEGFDESWSAPTKTNNVQYVSLPPGTYTFMVLASNPFGMWGKDPAVFPFRIVQPFYMNTWFIVTAVALLLLLFYFFQIYRLKQRVRVEKLRVHIARDLHDDIGSALGSINLLSENAARRLGNVSLQEISNTFTKIGGSAQTTLEAMDDIIWAINPDKDSMADLLIRMREYAIPLLEAQNISIHFDQTPGDYGKLPMDVRRNIFLLFKESVNNIIKHASATSVSIHTSSQHNIFRLIIKDNGKGFDTMAQTQRNGLKNMNKRAEILKGTLNITSEKGKGTTLDLQCPIE